MIKIKLILPNGKAIDALIRERHLRKIDNKKVSWWERVKRWWSSLR
ncbi:MAG: hypothetical protein HY096_09810 [Nitrospinae bacterium]|nr:hypothetical protein [Nitrospinota bacterium]